MKRIIIAIMVLAVTGCDYSEGERAGVVVKLSRKGYICKSWEGELAMFGTRGVDQTGATIATASNTFAFSVLDDAVVEQIKQKMHAGERAALQYEQKILPPFCWRETEYVVVEVH